MKPELLGLKPFFQLKADAVTTIFNFSSYQVGTEIPSTSLVTMRRASLMCLALRMGVSTARPGRGGVMRALCRVLNQDM